MKKILLLSTVFAILSATPALAYFNLDNVFHRGFYNLQWMLNDTGIQSGIVLIMFFVLAFSILTVAIKQVKLFQSDKGVNNQGKAVAFVLALGGTIGVFFTGPLGFYEMSRKFLQMTRIYGMIVLAILTFLVTYFGLKPTENVSKTGWFLGSAGLALLVPAYLLRYTELISTGIILITIGAVWVVITVFKGGEESS